MNEEFREQIGSVEAVLAGIEAAGYVVVERERWERVRRFAEAANAVQQHKNDVLGRDTISLPEVERLNLRLHPLYAEMEAAWCALQPGDFGGEGGE